MKSYKNLFVVVFSLVFPCALPAATCNTLRAEYSDLPSNINEKQMFVDSNEYYLPFDDCSKPTDFEVTKLEEKVQMGYIPRDFLSLDFLHDNCIFRTIRVEYTLKCANKLKYKGTKYLLSKTRTESESLDWFGTEKEKMKNEVHDWINIPLDYLNPDGSITIDPVTGKTWGDKPEKLDIFSITEKWKKQKVAYPEYSFTGVPGKLPRPVLLVHGLDYAYNVWGVEVDSSGFENGKVKRYEKGSLPDILARSNNLDTDENSINSNGIYFFQSPGKKDTLQFSSGKIDTVWKDVKPDWGNNPDSSQSRNLYNKIELVMDDFYGNLNIEWRKSDKYQIDLVGHSQGGLVIREMLRGLQQDEGSFPQGTANAANHINRVITINTPHFGSVLATDINNLASIEQEFYGVATVIRDIETPIEHTLVEVDVDIDTKEIFRDYTQSFPTLSVLAPAVDIILGVTLAAVKSLDIVLAIKGPYLGAYKPELFIDNVGSIKLGSINTVAKFKDRLEKPRKSGSHLDKNNSFIKNLNIGDFFPRRPDGSKITLLPMYSDSTNKIMSNLFEIAGEEAKMLCAQGDKSKDCFAIGNVLERYSETAKYYNVSKPEFDKGLWDAILNIQNNWLAHGDAVVEDSSQKFVSNTNKPDNKYFLEPRKYAIHDALAPWEPVLHGPFGSYKGAPQQGLDILCALSAACDKAFSAAKGDDAVFKLSEMVYRGGFNENSLDVIGDFDLAPIFISEGIQAFSISANGEPILTAKYESDIGSSITLHNNESMPSSMSMGIMPLAKKLAVPVQIEQTELLWDSSIATQPSMMRKGDSIYVTFTNYSGKPFQEVYYLPELPNTLTATVMASGYSMSPVIIGNATAANPETQKPSVPPPGHKLAPITLAVLHREARGEHESNTSRPRFLVFNATEDTLEFSKVVYYFTADPARTPKVVVDYPYVPVSLENLGGDQWRFVLDVGSQKIAPKAFYPSADGWQIRMHYSDWYGYDHFGDWSADYSIGFVQLNRKIVIYDKNGKIIWGNEAPGFESEDDGIIPMPKGTIAWQDDAPWETNAFKPRVTVKNTGSVALSDYRAQLWFRVPHGKSLSPINIWHTPESSPSVKNVGNRVWVLDLNFNKHILYSGDSVSEGNIGLNLMDWSSFDKTVCGIALKDKDGNILYGKEPSVTECESYNGPDLLLPIYSWIKE
jgi:hypothetical protein